MAMPTRFARIPITKDLALAEALDRVAPLVEPGQPAATLVHDLAIRGAEALLVEHGQNADAVERLIERSTSADPDSTSASPSESTSSPGAYSRE